MLVDKYNMTMEENILYAKRNIVDSIWKSANLEGIPVTFSETQAIYDGANVEHLRIDEIQAINNLKHAWQYIIFSMNAEMNLKFIESIHAFVGANIVEQPGKLRNYEVSMGGTKWKPKLPSEEKMNDLIAEYENDLDDGNITDAIFTFMCRLMKTQAFNDGNKRTAMLVANHQLIKYGKGIISISDEDRIEFGTKLIEYYEDEEKIEDLKDFLYEKCLDGIQKNNELEK